MDAKLKKKWVQALRSGKYKQARGQLRDGSAYCCLGVLCRIAKFKISRNGDRIIGSSRDYDPIWEAIGDEVFARDLSMANDKGESFDTIANMIESAMTAGDRNAMPSKE